MPPEFREEVGTAEAGAVEMAGGPISAPVDLRADEAGRILRALDRTDGKIGEAAALLGISRPTLWRKRKKYGI